MKLRSALIIIIALILTCCKSGYYTQDDYLKVLKIDSHLHINSQKGFLEDQALKDNFALITLGVDHADSTVIKQQLADALASIKKYPGKIFYGATFFFDTTGWEGAEWSNKVISHLEKDISGGAISVKLWKNIGMTVRDRNGKFIMVDDPALEPVIDYIISRKLPVTGHLGEPKNCWLPLNEMTVRGDSSYFAANPQYHMFLHPEFPSYDDQINARDHLLEMHPDLTFIGCHLASVEWSVDEIAQRLDRFPNMAVDMSARVCHLQYQSAKDREKVRNFCIKYQNRILYGTDIIARDNDTAERIQKTAHDTWSEDWKYFATNLEMTTQDFKGKFTGLQLPKEVVNKIFSENAIRVYKLDVK